MDKFITMISSSHVQVYIHVLHLNMKDVTHPNLSNIPLDHSPFRARLVRMIG